jgi:hypothetical protein
LLGWLLLGCATPTSAQRAAYLTPPTPALLPENGLPASSDYTLLGLVSGEACMPRRDLAGLGELPPSPAMIAEGGAGHPAVYQAAKYEALSKIENADNLTSIRVKVEQVGEQECVSVTGRAYRLTALQVKAPLLPSGGTVATGPMPFGPREAILATHPSKELLGVPPPAGETLGSGTSLFFTLPADADLGGAMRFAMPVGPRGFFPTHWSVKDRVVLDLQLAGIYDKVASINKKYVMLAPTLGLAYDVWLIRYAGLYTRFGFGYGALTTDTVFSSVDWKQDGLDFEVGFGTFFTFFGLGLQAEISHKGSVLVGLLFGF